MKINTDGVLLGTITHADAPQTVLDIGTGTGVIALMLAQKFANAQIHAVEIDDTAAKTAGRNFQQSIFNDRLTIYAGDISAFFEEHPENKYELVVSNPPFYINSLKSPGAKKVLAKHTDVNFFERLLKGVSDHLTPNGCCWLILPANIAEIVIELAVHCNLHPQELIKIYSYTYSDAHRVIICFGLGDNSLLLSNFTIYKAAGVYSEEYQKLLQPYFIAF